MNQIHKKEYFEITKTNYEKIYVVTNLVKKKNRI